MLVKLHFKNYIAHPYWPETEQLVSIQKQSGMNRARSEENRESALRRYLEKIGMSYSSYQKLELDAKRPWYYDKEGHIYVPRHHLTGALVQGAKSAPSGAKFNQEQLRCLLQVSDFQTDRTKADEVFERYILPTGPNGVPISNQRRFASNEVIKDFVATGRIDFDPSDVKEKSVLDLLTYVGKYVGVGASRKMGYGRFILMPAKS